MSRQMDFQFTGAQLCEMVLRVHERVGKIPSGNLETALAEKFPDEKERRIARASIIVLVKCFDTKRNFEDVKKVIVWRDSTGKPQDIQIEFGRRSG